MQRFRPAGQRVGELRNACRSRRPALRFLFWGRRRLPVKWKPMQALLAGGVIDALNRGGKLLNHVDSVCSSTLVKLGNS